LIDTHLIAIFYGALLLKTDVWRKRRLDHLRSVTFCRGFGDKLRGIGCSALRTAPRGRGKKLPRAAGQGVWSGIGRVSGGVVEPRSGEESAGLAAVPLAAELYCWQPSNFPWADAAALIATERTVPR